MMSKNIIFLSVLIATFAAGGLFAWKILPAFNQSSKVSNVHLEEKEKEYKKSSAEQKEHAGEEEENIVKLNDKELNEFGIVLETVGSEKLKSEIELPGEVKPDADFLAHIVPRVPGVVQKVTKKIGDLVRKGEIMAILESRDLADAKSAYLAANERIALAAANFKREKDLWEKKISSKKEYLEAKQALAEANIKLRSTEQKLHALGFSDDYLTRLPEQADVSFTRYEMRAPFDGTVIEKHITLGEMLKDDKAAFVIADLSTVWVDIQIYQKQLASVRKGQDVILSAGHNIPDRTEKISYIGPLVKEKTRTGLARIVLRNPKGLWRPGLFVNAKIAIDGHRMRVSVSSEAIQVKGKDSFIFVQTEKKGVFVMRKVKTGIRDGDRLEILSGLRPGEIIAAQGGFLLRSEIEKSGFEAGHHD